jgi:hypothetical protein
MLDFIYWITSIIIPLIVGGIAFKNMNKLKNIKIKQEAERLESVVGAEFNLQNGENIHIKNMDIEQNALAMNNVKGLSFMASGTQSARLQGVRIKQPYSEIIISDDPNVFVEINKQG